MHKIYTCKLFFFSERLVNEMKAHVLFKTIHGHDFWKRSELQKKRASNKNCWEVERTSQVSEGCFRWEFIFGHNQLAGRFLATQL